MGEFIKSSDLITTAVVGALVMLFLVLASKKPRKLRPIIFPSIWFSGVIFTLLLSFNLVKPLAVFLMQAIGLRTFQLVIATGAVILGYAAHAFKQRNKKLYGRCEVVFAILYAIKSSDSIDGTRLNQLALWTAVLGSMYVVARGLNNISDAKKEEERSI